MATGSIERLPSGNFRAVVRAGKDPITGQRVKLTETCDTEDGARTARDRMLVQVDAENHPARSATVAMLMERWMEIADHELTTRETTASYVRRVINPALGTWLVRKLQHRVDIIDRLYKHLGRCGALCDGRPFTEHKRDGDHDCTVAGCRPHKCTPLSPGTVRRIHGILSPALSYAVSWGWIEKNPAEYAHPPKLKRRRAKPPADEMVARLLNLAFATSVEFAIFLWLATTTGARRGELAALRWSAVNLRAGIITIEKNYVQRAGQSQLKETKTDSDRRLSLGSLTVQLLTDFHQQLSDRLAPAHLSLADDAFVFSPDPAGLTPWHPDHFSHTFRELADLMALRAVQAAKTGGTEPAVAPAMRRVDRTARLHPARRTRSHRAKRPTMGGGRLMTWFWLPLALQHLVGIEPGEVLQALSAERRWSRLMVAEDTGIRVLTIRARTRTGRPLKVAVRHVEGREWQIIAAGELTSAEDEEPNPSADVLLPPRLGDDEVVLVRRTFKLPTEIDAGLRAAAAAEHLTVEELLSRWTREHNAA